MRKGFLAPLAGTLGLPSARAKRAVSLFAVVLAACGGVQVHREVARGAELAPKLVAVYPFGLRWKAAAYRAYELGMDETAAVVADGRWATLGPSEFQVYDYEHDQLFAATDLAGKLPGWGLTPDDVLALRGWAERRETQGARTVYDPNGRPVGQRRTADVEVVIHEELLAPPPEGVVAEVWAEVPVDPFADHPSWDPNPELRRWAVKLTRRLLDEARARIAAADPPEDPGFDAELNPRDEEALALPGRAALAELYARANPLDREAARLDRLLYFSPDLPVSRAEQLARLPQGLLVTAVRRKARAAGLRAGDFVARVHDEPCAGMQTVLRWLALTGHARLGVLRDGDHVTIDLTR